MISVGEIIEQSRQRWVVFSDLAFLDCQQLFQFFYGGIHFSTVPTQPKFSYPERKVNLRFCLFSFRSQPIVNNTEQLLERLGIKYEGSNKKGTATGRGLKTEAHEQLEKNYSTW